MDVDLETQWEQFMNTDFNEQELKSYDHQYNNYDDCENTNCDETIICPECSPLRISTKTKIIYLNTTFDLNDLFWKLKIINYDEEKEGVIKKQIKFNFTNSNEVQQFENKIMHEPNARIKILNQINNPNGRVQFKDVRKVDIGHCKNDIINPKKETKSAFYNCFVMFFRKFFNRKYQEFHVFFSNLN